MFLTLPLMDMEYLTRICKDLYFCVEECSQSHFAIVNCVLSYLFLEYGPSRQTDPAMANYAEYSTLCRTNFETVISSFNHCMEPSYENVLALAFGVSDFLRRKHLIGTLNSQIPRLSTPRNAPRCHSAGTSSAQQRACVKTLVTTEEWRKKETARMT